MKKVVVKATAVFFALLFSLSFLAGCQDNEPTFLEKEEGLIEFLEIYYDITNINKYSKTETMLTLSDGMTVDIEYNRKNEQIKSVTIDMKYDETISAQHQETFIDCVVSVCLRLDIDFSQETQVELRKSLKKSFSDKEHNAFYSSSYAHGSSFNFDTHINFLLLPKETY